MRKVKTISRFCVQLASNPHAFFACFREDKDTRAFRSIFNMRAGNKSSLAKTHTHQNSTRVRLLEYVRWGENLTAAGWWVCSLAGGESGIKMRTASRRKRRNDAGRQIRTHNNAGLGSALSSLANVSWVCSFHKADYNHTMGNEAPVIMPSLT